MPGRILDWIAASRKPSTPPPQPPPSSSAQPDTLPRSRSPGAAGAAAPANRTAGTTHRVRAQSKRRGSPSPSRSPRRMSAVLIPGTATAATTSAPTMPAPPAADSSYMGAAASLPTTHALLADNDALRAEVADLRSVILQYEHYMAATDPHVPVSVRDALAPQRPPPLAHLVAMIHPGSPTPANTVISPPTTTATMNSTAQARRPSLDGGASVRGRGRTVSSSSAASVRHHGSKRGSGKGKDRAGWTKMRKKLGRLLSTSAPPSHSLATAATTTAQQSPYLQQLQEDLPAVPAIPAVFPRMISMQQQKQQRRPVIAVHTTPAHDHHNSSDKLPSTSPADSVLATHGAVSAAAAMRAARRLDSANASAAASPTASLVLVQTSADGDAQDASLSTTRARSPSPSAPLARVLRPGSRSSSSLRSSTAAPASPAASIARAMGSRETGRGTPVGWDQVESLAVAAPPPAGALGARRAPGIAPDPASSSSPSSSLVLSLNSSVHGGGVATTDGSLPRSRNPDTLSAFLHEFASSYSFAADQAIDTLASMAATEHPLPPPPPPPPSLFTQPLFVLAKPPQPPVIELPVLRAVSAQQQQQLVHGSAVARSSPRARPAGLSLSPAVRPSRPLSSLSQSLASTSSSSASVSLASPRGVATPISPPTAAPFSASASLTPWVAIDAPPLSAASTATLFHGGSASSNGSHHSGSYGSANGDPMPSMIIKSMASPPPPRGSTPTAIGEERVYPSVARRASARLLPRHSSITASSSPGRSDAALSVLSPAPE